MRFIVLLCGLILTACATPDTYSPYVNSFVGKQESDLLRAFGAPDKAYQSGGVKIVTYINEQGAAATPMFGAWISQRRYCQTNFTLEQERVKAANWNGNICEGPEDKSKIAADAEKEKKKAQSNSIVDRTDSFH